MKKLLTIALAGALAACGSGDGATDTTVADTTSTSSVAETTTTGAETTTTGEPATTTTTSAEATSTSSGGETTTTVGSETTAPGGADEIITPDGFWEVRIGDTVGENEARIGGPFDVLGGSDPTSCVVLQLPEVGGLSFIAGTLTGEPIEDPDQLVMGRVSADAPGWETAQGVEVGMPVDEAESLLEDSITERRPHTYVEGGEYLVVGPEDARYVFETDGDTVTAIHAGTEPIVSYVEACS
jgi:hypothetical protein